MKMTKNDHDTGRTDRWTYGQTSQKTSNIKALCFVVLDKKFFSCLKHVTPGASPFLVPGA